MTTYLVVRQPSNSTAPVAFYQDAPSKSELKSYFLDWDFDTPEITWQTLVIKRVNLGN